MSVISMTGFGRGEAQGGGTRVIAEISSVNRKQFDCSVSLPREYAACEARVVALVRATVRRGHVKGGVSVSRAAGDGAGEVDLKRARARLYLLRRAARELGLPDDLTASRLAEWHDVVRVDAPAPDLDRDWPLIERAVQQALARLDAMRRREGKSLARDLVGRVRRLRRSAGDIRTRAPRVAASYRAALAARIAAVTGGLQLDAAVLAREVALFADRCDISEELTRLASHFEQFDGLLSGGESCGRTLDFLCQEIAREINTIGSKANDSAISRQVVMFKAELEAVREQAQNIE